MAEMRIQGAVASDLATAIKGYEIYPRDTDAVTGEQEETTWINQNWSKWFGYYKQIPELKAAIDAKARWTIGKGFIADADTMGILNFINGFGKDTFNTILENAVRVYHIGGDFFAEIIRDDDGEIINLKPLDPATIQIVVDRKGIIKRYEQISKIKQPIKKFSPENIFHLPRDRVADEFHGQSLVEALENIILSRNEAMEDLKEVFHRFVKPKFIFHLDTDDPTEINQFKAKMDTATGKGENMYIPKDAVVPESLSIAANATLNPLPWIESLNNYFFQAVGVPQIIVGGSQEFTEATAKIAYLAFQQVVEEEQLFIEEQIFEQLGFRINLQFPASLENELLSDNKKDGAVNVQPNETTAGAGQ